MSAEFNTEIQVQGTKEELFAIIKAVFDFSKWSEKNKKKYAPHIESIHVSYKGEELCGEKAKDINDFLNGAQGKIEITAAGPYGFFENLYDVGLFQFISKAAPQAYFKGIISGYRGSADEWLEVEQNNGKLYFKSSECDQAKEDRDGEYGQYIRFIKNQLPYSEFCRLFQINQEEFLSEDYTDLIDGLMMESSLFEMDYQQFMENCPMSSLDEGAFYDIIKEIENLILPTFNEFMCEYYDETLCEQEWDEECFDSDYDEDDEEDEEDGDYEDYDEEEEDY